MNKDLRIILRKIAKFDLKIILSKWGRIPIHEINFNKTKYEVIEQIMELSMIHGVQIDDIQQLDLLYLSEHSNKKLWRAYKFNDPNQMSRDDSMLEAQMFQKCLSQKLFIAHSCSVHVRKEKHMLWGRVNQPSSIQVLYFIYFPFSPYILLNKTSNKLTSLFIQAVKQLLGYKSFEDMELESYSPDSLAQIVLHNLDSSESYLFDEGYFKPSKRHGKEIMRECDSRVKIQHKDKLLKTKALVDRSYGRNLQPQLPLLNIATNTGFRGQSFLPNVPTSTLINCKTKIIGSNVLEGMRKAALLDLCRVPIPTFLTDVAKTGQQYIKLTDKKKEIT